jgi:acetyl-CoA acetyltransferase family protein
VVSRTPALVLDARRTVFGKNRGALSGIRTDDLAALPLADLAGRTPGLAEAVDDVLMGNTNGAGEDNRNVARMATLLAGYPTTIPAATVNRLCGSGGEAVVQAARAVTSGDLDLLIAGGVEGMSRAPLVLTRAERPFDTGQQLTPTTVGWRLPNPRFPTSWVDSLGTTVERSAAELGISRAEQDEFAVRSHVLAHQAWEKQTTTGVAAVAGLLRDESIRPDTRPEDLAALPAAFLPDGTLTAGNSSPINDGAAALVIGSPEAARQLDYEPTVRIVGSQAVGVDPDRFAHAPAQAVRRLLARHQVAASAVDVWEVNEAFAAVVLCFLREFSSLGVDDVNRRGGALAIGHPLGASMARVVADAAQQLHERGGGTAVVTACIGVGQGLAILLDTDVPGHNER